MCGIKIPLLPAASSTRRRAWLLDPCVLRETFRLHSFVFRALSRCSLSPSVHSLSFHFTHFHILFPQVLLRFSPSYCPLMSPPPLWFPFCPSKCCHQTPFITYFSVQDTLLSQGNRKNNIIRKILRKEKKKTIQISKCLCIFFCFGNFASSWCSLFISSITGCLERPGPIFAVSVKCLVHLNLDPKRCLRLWLSTSFGIYHVS